MGADLPINVSDLDAAHRRALEEMIGRELTPNQRLTLSVSEIATPPSTPKPAQSLDDWTQVYNGLSDDEIDEIDRIIKTRANLTRLVP